MAVQAPHHHLHLPDLREPIYAGGGGEVIGVRGEEGPAVEAAAVEGGAAISVLKSGLTSNKLGTKKRAREVEVGDVRTPLGLISSGVEWERMIGSFGSSTSGRPSGDLLSHLYHHSLEIDSLIMLQSERIRTSLEVTRRRHIREVVSSLKRRAAVRLREKQMELEAAAGKNADLEEKVRRAAAEIQIWSSAARSREAIVADLRSSLDQALSRNAAVAANTPPPAEGFGESGNSATVVVGTDGGVSSSDMEKENRELRQRVACKTCGARDVRALLLPCRHLCVCDDCESQIDACPICRSLKTGSLHVFLSYLARDPPSISG